MRTTAMLAAIVVLDARFAVGFGLVSARARTLVSVGHMVDVSPVSPVAFIGLLVPRPISAVLGASFL